MTVKSLYEEYEREHPDGYRHASFGKYLRQYMLGTRVIGHVEHYAGDQMYIDFAGDKLEVVDAETGEVRGVEVFVAILPCSHYTYCEAVWSQQKGDLIKACENALHFYGGAPLAIVPDNLKSPLYATTATSLSSTRSLPPLPSTTGAPSILHVCVIRKTRHWWRMQSS